jgi:starvation-inducible DNA-binding protein
MFSTRIDIPAKQRPALIELINQRLADMIDLHLQTKQAHWNVKGPSFIALHELFDDIAGEVDEHADSIAERAIALGGEALGSLQEVSKQSKLKPYPLHLKTGKEHVEALADALAAVGKSVRAAIDQSNELGDADTADLFTGISRDLDKKLWFVEAHVQADR